MASEWWRHNRRCKCRHAPDVHLYGYLPAACLCELSLATNRRVYWRIHAGRLIRATVLVLVSITASVANARSRGVQRYLKKIDSLDSSAPRGRASTTPGGAIT